MIWLIATQTLGVALGNLQGQIDSSLKLIQDLNNRVIALEKKGE